MSKFASCEAVEKLLDELPNGLPSTRWTRFEVRDFLMACLLVLGGGHRRDVIRNMTVEEFAAARRKNGIWQVLVFRHKTGGSGPAYLSFIDDRLFDCCSAYLKHVRPEFVAMAKSPRSDEDGKLPFFLSDNGSLLDRNVNATDFFKKQIVALGVATKAELKNLTGKCFRSAMSTWGSNHPEEKIRNHIAFLQVCFMRIGFSLNVPVPVICFCNISFSSAEP